MRTSMDKQQIEAIGRNRLVSELIAADLEVAIPIRDRGVDIVAYREIVGRSAKFRAIPIQMKAASRQAFSVDEKYKKISNLLIAFVWGVQESALSATYVLTYNEAMAITRKMKYKFSNGKFSTTRPSQKLIELLRPHMITSTKQWWQKVKLVSDGAH